MSRFKLTNKISKLINNIEKKSNITFLSEDKYLNEQLLQNQELFLQKDLKGVPSDKITAMATDRLNRLLGDHYTLYSDGYTGGVAIPQGIKYDGITHIDRPDSGKKCMVIKNVTHNDKTFNIVNIHLKSIVMFPITGKRLQQAEMKNIIVNTKGPTLFMGDFNTENPEQLF